jgi:hypothetical protein
MIATARGHSPARQPRKVNVTMPPGAIPKRTSDERRQGGPALLVVLPTDYDGMMTGRSNTDEWVYS